MKRFLFACAILSSLVPFTASALTVDELRVQIEGLLKQIDTLQRQLGATPGGQTYVPQTSGTVPASFDCPYISRSLRIGSSGSDVSRLQQFLAFNPTLYPEAQVSGYYGALTEAAVKRFQCTNKIVCEGGPDSTGYGVTGPRTASLLALQCAERARQGQASGFIRVTPISGAAPLPVTVEATVNTSRSCSASSYELDFGDNSQRIPINVPANACNEVRQSFTHTYPGGGVFSVLLRSGSHQVSATVNVSGAPVNTNSSGDTFTVTRVSGDSPLTVDFRGTINFSGICNAGPYSIIFGDGQSTNLNIAGCTPNAYNVSHRYDREGTFIARLMRGNVEVDREQIVVGSGSGGGYFAVTPRSEDGTFTVEAEFELENSCARYELEWGDGSRATQSEGNCSGNSYRKTLTHTYGDSDTYTLILRRGSNLSEEDRIEIAIQYD